MHTLQERLEDEEMEKMRLAAALATLRADMESLSAAHPAPDMRLTQQVSELECQLATAQRDVQRLASDNDALMEVSNALAAQQRRACQKQEAEAREDARRPPQRTPVGVQHRHPPPWWPPQPQYVIMPPLVPPAPVPVAPTLPVPVPVQYTAAQQAPHAWASQFQSGAAGQHAQHAQQEAPVHAMPAHGISADVAARLQRIEALAEEIARAQVAGGHPQDREADSGMRPGSTFEASHGADEPRRRGSAARASDFQTAARKGCFQREKLRALQQRPPMPKVPRVRNWNIVDDDAV
ncbi:hypothetical protein CVIRNUC_011188 [Coccomyxa viridis]|uniref:Uncharacterized protein n=1 Tax=Coccomyxa viridis TaxID=1274662 RepID=A0AAV1IKV0_9CHLO|nr:hypothetical protein CVIRNUC_011188 [Coccomyxa viridis]